MDIYVAVLPEYGKDFPIYLLQMIASDQPLDINLFLVISEGTSIYLALNWHSINRLM
jgi:hypothetical protein